MTSKAMRRATRSAPALIDGQELLEFVTARGTRKKLIAAVESGVPPVSAISGELRQRFETMKTKSPVGKQFVGLCVRAVLEEEGYEACRTGVRLHRDPVFTTGSVYRRMGEQSAAEPADDALERMMGSLTEADALRAARALEKAFPGVLRRARALTR